MTVTNIYVQGKTKLVILNIFQNGTNMDFYLIQVPNDSRHCVEQYIAEYNGQFHYNNLWYG